MAVKAITDAQKELIRVNYVNKRMNQKQMAEALDVSERTINRVLNELGLLTAVPRLKGEAHQALTVLAAWGIAPARLQECLAELEDAGLLVTEDGKITAIARPAPTRDEIIAAAVKLEEGTWAAMLSDIVTARVAFDKNRHVQTHMLNIQNKVEANARKPD
jgi:DNA-binding transcriptional regulator YhcF (GntR family)